MNRLIMTMTLIYVCVLIGVSVSPFLLGLPEIRVDEDIPVARVGSVLPTPMVVVDRGNNSFSYIAISKEEYNLRVLFNAICEVESNGDDTAYNALEDAKGAAQIRSIMVDDVNRIQTVHGQEKRYVHEDARNRELAFEMFKIYTDHYSAGAMFEVKARNWNGGPNGHIYKGTQGYWRRVKQALEDARELIRE